MYLKSNTIPDALQELSALCANEFAALEGKANDTFPKPIALEPFPKLFSFSAVEGVNIDISTNWWNYSTWCGSWRSIWYPIEDVEKLTTRKNLLLEKVDEWEAACNGVEERNKEVIAHNQEVHVKIGAIMDHLGVKRSCSEVDHSSRSRTLKYITKPAGWLSDVAKVAPTVQWSDHKRSAADKRSLIEAGYRAAVNAINEKLRKTLIEKQKVEFEAKAAFYKVKYECSLTSDIEDALDTILNKCKYLRLAHYLEKNRNDWTEGYDYAERGIDGFVVETDEDAKIQKCISEVIERDDVDGRYFRDCEYGYGYLFSLVDSALLKDYEQVVQTKGNE